MSADESIPNSMPFVRFPPNITPPTMGSKNDQLKNRPTNNHAMNIKLQDFQHMYQKYASQLFEMSPSGLLPPGHPLFSRQNSITTLQSEINKLQKENYELKKQLENSVKKST